MKKTSFGTLIIWMAFAAVLAGCGTIGGSETSATGSRTPPTLEVQQLAADLNKIKAGSAAVDGATVRLIGGVHLKAALTVPAGVTLDLTAEGVKFELQDKAKLTVNGTVIASGHGDQGKGWVEGGLRVVDGDSVISGSGTIRLQSKGRLLSIGGDKKNKRHLTLDGVTLVGIVDNNESLVSVNENGEFIMKSGAITGNTRNGEGWTEGGGVRVKGTFSMSGGEISGNNAAGNGNALGGGVAIEGGGRFTLSGSAKISGNSAVADYATGGGVEVGEESVFTITGGEISGNSATDGAGVHVGVGWDGKKGGTFTMSGGTISGNAASSQWFAGSGGVGVGCIFTMTGGTISNNSVNSIAEGGMGGGVSIYEGATFTMSGGVISGNKVTGKASANGGGIWVSNAKNRDPGGTFIMKGGVIYGSSAGGGNANTATTGAALFVGRGGTAKYGNGNNLMDFGQDAAAIGLTERTNDRLVKERDGGGSFTVPGGTGSSRTLAVDAKTGALTVTP